MRAAVAASQNMEDPLSCLQLVDHPEPAERPGWTKVRLRAAALNYHDIWSLRGVGLDAKRLPIVLGCDGAGVTADGREVIVHSVIADPDGGDGDETLDPKRALLSEQHDGTFAEWISVPDRNILPKPAHLSFEEAACLPVAWLTAYRMLFTKAQVRPGHRVLVQGAAGGVTSAAITMAAAAGAVVYATSRSPEKRELALRLGAHHAVASGERLPEKMDVVIETVGAATWEHSMRALRPGGIIVVSGATSGANPPADLMRVFYLQLRIAGSTGGTRGELERMLRFVADKELRPLIDRVLPMAEIHAGFQAMLDGELNGKVVVRP